MVSKVLSHYVAILPVMFSVGVIVVCCLRMEQMMRQINANTLALMDGHVELKQHINKMVAPSGEPKRQDMPDDNDDDLQSIDDDDDNPRIVEDITEDASDEEAPPNEDDVAETSDC